MCDGMAQYASTSGRHNPIDNGLYRLRVLCMAKVAEMLGTLAFHAARIAGLVFAPVASAALYLAVFRVSAPISSSQWYTQLPRPAFATAVTLCCSPTARTEGSRSVSMSSSGVRHDGIIGFHTLVWRRRIDKTGLFVHEVSATAWSFSRLAATTVDRARL